MSDTTPWWERPSTQPADGGDEGCSISTSVTHSCKTAPDENGVMRRKCERITRKFRTCPGREPEELEAEREETDDEVPGGRGSSSVFTSSSSSSYATETHGGSGVSLPDIFPEGVSFPFGASGFPAGFPFGEWLGGGGDARSPASPPSFFGAMAAAFRGMYEIAREMERLEKGEETRRRAADPKETTPAARGDDE